mmetsp:Transcript_6561/g.26708  ORF Transcript_6561/g.26708 Transcript_6561/m.26708 type:complete len:236 (-) Transcript_6561:3315-4022(-)
MTGRSASCAAWTSAAEIRRISPWASSTPSRGRASYRASPRRTSAASSRSTSSWLAWTPPCWRRTRSTPRARCSRLGPFWPTCPAMKRPRPRLSPCSTKTASRCPSSRPAASRPTSESPTPRKFRALSISPSRPRRRTAAATAASSPSRCTPRRSTSRRTSTGTSPCTLTHARFRRIPPPWTPSCAMVRIPRRSSSPAKFEATARCRTSPSRSRRISPRRTASPSSSSPRCSWGAR